MAEEIQNAITAGKEVTVHEKAINAYGFSGFGYTIIDPETGVGGYLIEGKGSGGSLDIPTSSSQISDPLREVFYCGLLSAYSAVAIITIMAYSSLALLGVIALFLTALFFLQQVLDIALENPSISFETFRSCFLAGFFVGLAVTGLVVDGWLGKFLGVLGVAGYLFNQGNLYSCHAIK